MAPEQLSEIVRQVSAIFVLLAGAYFLHRGTIVLGREYRSALEARDKAEARADAWQRFALDQLEVSGRAVGAAERILPPKAGP